MTVDVHVNRWGSICSIFVVLVSAVQFLWRLLQPPASPAFSSTAGPQRLQAILPIGLIAAAAHCVLWSLAERHNPSNGAPSWDAPRTISQLLDSLVKFFSNVETRKAN